MKTIKELIELQTKNKRSNTYVETSNTVRSNNLNKATENLRLEMPYSLVELDNFIQQQENPAKEILLKNMLNLKKTLRDD